MERGVGAILCEARRRREVDLSAVEASTRIRQRYLRAIEAEEWDALPGGVYTRGFIRTYGAYLGLDGERLAADYRRDVEGWPSASEPAPSPGQRHVSKRMPHPGGRWRPPLVVVAVLALAVVVIVLIPLAGDGGEDGRSPAPSHSQRSAAAAPQQASRPRPTPGVSMRLAAAAEVWVCVLDARGRPLVDGQILEAGSEEGPFRSGSFLVAFGNGEVRMLIDGRETDIPATSSPVGYAIGPDGTLTALSEVERPTCT
jgi:hypothetical protein